MTDKTTGVSSFNELDLAPRLLQQLNKLNFTTPTPIQAQAIPVGLAGEDMIGIAQTGTGKTLAFAIPMIQKLADGENMGLVVLPTRELALQVQEEITKVGAYFGIKTALLIGGASSYIQCKQINRRPNVIIATPGRLIDHIEQCNIRLDKVTFLVLDEADRMLDMGFEPQIKRVLASVPRKRSTFLFSATMPPKIEQIAKKYMNEPVRIEVSPAGSTTDKITQEAYVVEQRAKFSLLERLVKDYDHGPILVFTRTKYGAKKLALSLRKSGVKAAEIHSNRSLAQRREALAGFKSGKYNVLVATDVASRGIDVNDISLVVNYDVPEQSEDYVHRIGRTGRAGKEGLAVTFFCPDQRKEMQEIEYLIKTKISMQVMPGIPSAQFDLAPPIKQKRGARRASSSNQGRRDSGGGGYRGGSRSRNQSGRRNWQITGRGESSSVESSGQSSSSPKRRVRSHRKIKSSTPWKNSRNPR